jgi:hypothetical protein
MQFGATRQFRMVVAVSILNRASLHAVQLARSLSRDVTAVIVDIDPQATARVEENWQAWNLKVPLVVLKSLYRSVVRPLLTYLEETDQRGPERGLAVVILPEIVPARRCQNLLHNQTTLLIKAVLLFRQERGGAARVVIHVPYHLHG